MPAFKHSLRVRLNECDAQHVVLNSCFFVFFDVTMTELFRASCGSYDKTLQEHGLDLVVGEANVQYWSPIRFDDELEVAATIERLGTSGMTARYNVFRAGENVAEGRLRYVFVDLQDRGTRPIPDNVRTALQPYAGGPTIRKVR